MSDHPAIAYRGESVGNDEYRSMLPGSVCCTICAAKSSNCGKYCGKKPGSGAFLRPMDCQTRVDRLLVHVVEFHQFLTVG